MPAPNTPKAVHEALCAAQTALGQVGDALAPQHREQLGELLAAVEEHRPLVGPNGKHGERHTATCGCEGHRRSWAIELTPEEPPEWVRLCVETRHPIDTGNYSGPIHCTSHPQGHPCTTALYQRRPETTVQP